MSVSCSRTRVLVTVMTYPHPSVNYRELVCIAGITEAREWVRLYPVHYRYLPGEQRFRKFQWIEVDLEPQGHGNDRRKESRRPRIDTIHVTGEPLSTRDKWRERWRIIDALPHRTLTQLRRLYDTDRTSLGIVRPKRILDLKVEPSLPVWKPEWEALFSQLRLFGPQQKPLRVGGPMDGRVGRGDRGKGDGSRWCEAPVGLYEQGTHVPFFRSGSVTPRRPWSRRRSGRSRSADGSAARVAGLGPLWRGEWT